MTKLPRITVMTPNLDGEDYLERAICSVLDQGYENLEYIVVDGGSTDASVEILRLYEGDLAAWTSQPDDGPADAVNKAMALATGDVFCVLPSDDLLLPGALLSVGEVFADASVDWLVGACTQMDRDDRAISTVEARAPGSLLGYLMHDTGYLPLSSTFLRSSLLRDRGRFDASMRFAWDYEYWGRLLADGVEPICLGSSLSGKRLPEGSRNAAETMRRGAEFIAAARVHGSGLKSGERSRLWKNCDRRERIYALARAETVGRNARRFLLNELIKHPWWLGDAAISRALFQGIRHEAPQQLAA